MDAIRHGQLVQETEAGGNAADVAGRPCVGSAPGPAFDEARDEQALGWFAHVHAGRQTGGRHGPQHGALTPAVHAEARRLRVPETDEPALAIRLEAPGTVAQPALDPTDASIGHRPGRGTRA